MKKITITFILLSLITTASSITYVATANSETYMKVPSPSSNTQTNQSSAYATPTISPNPYEREAAIIFKAHLEFIVSIVAVITAIAAALILRKRRNGQRVEL